MDIAQGSIAVKPMSTRYHKALPEVNKMRTRPRAAQLIEEHMRGALGGYFLAAFIAAALQDGATGPGRHAGDKAMNAGSMTFFRLECSLGHMDFLMVRIQHRTY